MGSKRTKAGRRASRKAYCKRAEWTREMDVWFASRRGRAFASSVSGVVRAIRGAA